LLLQGEKDFRIHHEKIPVAAEIFKLDHFSAHADSDDSLRWLAQMPTPPKKVILNHGEDGPRRALAEKLKARWPGMQVVIPEDGEAIDVP